MFKFSEYTQMKQDFQSQIKKLLIVNNKYKVENFKVEDLEEPRRHQVLFLEKCIVLLEEYKPKDKPDDIALKAKILTGCMYVIYDEIKSTYRLTDPLLHSGLYGGLQVTMGITLSNTLDWLSQRSILDLLDQFMIHYIHVDGKLRNDLRTNHPFANISNFDLNSFSERVIDLRADACKELKNEQHAKLKIAEEQAKQQAKQRFAELPTSSSSSYFGRLWSNAPQQVVAREVLGTAVNFAAASAKKDEDFPALSVSSLTTTHN